MLILGRRSASGQRSIGFRARMGPPNSAGELITYAGDGHLITFAPTGTGKTSGPVICNALSHPGQLIVIDIKGEVHAATAQRRRAMGQEVHVIDMRDGGVEGSLNPLDLAMRCGTEIAAIARSFAGEMVERSVRQDPFWPDWAETMIAGGITWLLADCPPEQRSLSRLFDLLASVEADADVTIATLLDKKEVKHRAARAALTSYLNLPDKETRPSVLGTTVSQLRLFDTGLVRRLTDTTTLPLDALIEGAPISLYFIVPPHRISAYRPLLRLWLTGLLLVLTQRSSLPADRTLVLCDEIGNLGRIDAFLTAATLMRSWGVTLWSFWQNAAQLQVYGTDANTFVDNAGVVQLFGARNRRMAQEFAALVGGFDAEAVMNMAPDEQLLLIEGGSPTRCRQVRYYSDEVFSADLTYARDTGGFGR